MPAYKDSKTGTWFVKFYCKDWTGENKQIKKRGFVTKREALDYERNYKIRQENNLDMTFGEFWKLYTEDVKNYVKLNTWLTKEHIVDTKILPYFKNLKMNEITPGDVGDVTKQYLYQLAFDDFIMKQGYRYVQNMFFCPDEIGDKQYGWVQMEILNHIGNKRLENIAVVKLCASKMYQLYLDNQTISEHEINQYIPDIGRQEISEQNFANRMLAYLMRITNASKMAEEIQRQK